jgi:hypothetical protein
MKRQKMAQFTDKKNQVWQVDLDPVIADEINQDHAIRIVDLTADPLLKLRTDLSVLCAVMLVICREQIAELGLTREQFLKRLPFPPDAMLIAIEESIVNFFPTGRHSHAREVLASYASMGSKTDALTTAKMQAVVNDPATMDMISRKADQDISKAMKTLIDSQLGT